MKEDIFQGRSVGNYTKRFGEDERVGAAAGVVRKDYGSFIRRGLLRAGGSRLRRLRVDHHGRPHDHRHGSLQTAPQGRAARSIPSSFAHLRFTRIQADTSKLNDTRKVLFCSILFAGSLAV